MVGMDWLVGGFMVGMNGLIGCLDEWLTWIGWLVVWMNGWH